MADKNVVKDKMAGRRRRRVRGKVFGTPECPRLTVCKTLNNITVQIVDDIGRLTLVGLASNSRLIRDTIEKTDTKTTVARKVGSRVAEMARAKGVEQVVFDRNRNRYHGRVKAAADGAREGGLKF